MSFLQVNLLLERDSRLAIHLSLNRRTPKILGSFTIHTYKKSIFDKQHFPVSLVKYNTKNNLNFGENKKEEPC